MTSTPICLQRRRLRIGASAFPFLLLTLAGAFRAPTPPDATTGTATTSARLLAFAADDPKEVDWRLLAGLDYNTGEISPELAALDGQVVKIPGFGVPLEDWAATATEFLLVPYVGACVHTPPPPPNQLVFVEMREGKRATLGVWRPIWIEGTLTIESTMSYYGEVGFRVDAERVYPY